MIEVIKPSASGGVSSLSAIGAVPNANGATITGSVLNLQPANTSFGGALTAADWTTFNDKQSKLVTTSRQTASYTLVLLDAGKLVEMNSASANNLTVPLNSTVAYSTGTQILLSQYGAGQTTVVATVGVTVRSSGGKLKLTAQYSGATLIKIATDEWYLFGDITT